MSDVQRPWWLIINKPAGLITTVQEHSRPNERVFIINGEPVVQSLTWLTCGPVGALIVISVLSGLAIALNVQAQGGLTKMLFIAAFLGLPALIWGGAVVAANRLSAPHLAAIRAAESQSCTIRLDQNQALLRCQPAHDSQEMTLPYTDIQQVHLKPAIGARNNKAVMLALETRHGSVTLLDEKLGTHPQKTDLVHEIETVLSQYAHSRPSTADNND